MITIDFNRVKIREKSVILDIGCGSGRHTGKAAGFENIFAVGTDLNLKDLKKAAQRLVIHESLNEVRAGYAFLNADALFIPFKNKSVDIVICSEVLEHIQQHHAAVSEIKRILKPGGTVCVSVPSYLPEKICWLLSNDYGKAAGGHIRIYKPKEILSLFTAKGFRLTDRHHAHGLHTPFWWLKCLAGPKKQESRLIGYYHDFLVWEMMKKPASFALIERLLNPFIGKSMVFYFRSGTI